MRLGSRSPDEFIQLLNKKNEEIQQDFLSKIIEKTKIVDTKAMMGDSTITEQKTFDPSQVTNYLENIIQKLEGWSIQNVSITNNEDLRRIFTKFEITEGNYLISGHLSLQFHVLLFYKPIQRVIDCQKELSEVIDKTKKQEEDLSNNSDQFVLEKLKEMGYKDFDHQKLFEIFYEDRFKVNQKVVPFGKAASLPTEPPIKLIKFLTIANPKPTPIFDLLLSDWSRKKRSNTLSLISDGIPVPLSSISYRTCDSKFLEVIYISIPFSEDPYLMALSIKLVTTCLKA